MERYRPSAVLRSLDSSRAQIARIYDHLLGGAYSFAVDRAAGERLKRLFPLGPQICMANRAFMLLATRSCAARGIPQFLDLGCGIPGAFTVHEAAQSVDPMARTVYVDHEPLAVVQTRSVLAGSRRAAAVHADLRSPDDVLTAPETRELLDFARPVALLLGAVLHFVGDGDDIGGVLDRYKSVLAPGSVLVISHLTADDHPEAVNGIAEVCEAAHSPLRLRSRAEFAELFRGFELAGRGIDYVSEWCPDLADAKLIAEPHWSMTYGAMGRKP